MFSLDDRALAFVLESLEGVNTFCSALASRVVATRGRMFTLAPAGTPSDRLYRFDEGGLLADNRNQSRGVKVDDGWLAPVSSVKFDQARVITTMLRDSHSRSCVIDDFNPIWDDPQRNYSLGDTAFGIGKETYHWFDARHEPETIRTALQDSDAVWHGVSAVSECPLPSVLPPSADWLIAQAKSATAIFCSAYDGEGFVGWRVAEA